MSPGTVCLFNSYNKPKLGATSLRTPTQCEVWHLAWGHRAYQICIPKFWWAKDSLSYIMFSHLPLSLCFYGETTALMNVVPGQTLELCPAHRTLRIKTVLLLFSPRQFLLWWPYTECKDAPLESIISFSRKWRAGTHSLLLVDKHCFGCLFCTRQGSPKAFTIYRETIQKVHNYSKNVCDQCQEHF